MCTHISLTGTVLRLKQHHFYSTNKLMHSITLIRFKLNTHPYNMHRPKNLWGLLIDIVIRLRLKQHHSYITLQAQEFTCNVLTYSDQKGNVSVTTVVPDGGLRSFVKKNIHIYNFISHNRRLPVTVVHKLSSGCSMCQR